jgi:hypothetical protein
MGDMAKRVAGAVVWIVVVATAATACSKSRSSPSADLSSLASALANQDAGGGGSAGGGNDSGGSPNDDAAAQGTAAPILGDNPGCHLLSAADVKSAVGMDLPSLLGNIGGGMQGNTGHQSCTYTGSDSGTGPDVNIEINTFVGTAKDQLATLRSNEQDLVDSDNQFKSGSAVLKDVSLGDSGYEADIHLTDGDDESVWFVKGDKLVNVEVGGGNAGGALALAQEIAGKI